MLGFKFIHISKRAPWYNIWDLEFIEKNGSE